MNSLYRIAAIMETYFYNVENQDLNSIFSGAIATELNLDDPLSARLYLLNLFESAIEEVSYLTLSPARLTSMVGNIKAAKGKYLNACCRGTTNEFGSIMELRQTIDLLSASGDAIHASGKFNDTPFDRKSFLSDTQRLCDIVEKSDMPMLQKSTMLLKLKSVNRITVECQYMSDSQLRQRVKSIVADFFVEFDGSDKKYRNVQETMVNWAKGVIPLGIVALSLTSDLSQVAGLLAPP